MLETAGKNALGTSGKAGFTHIGAVIDLSGTAVAGARQAITWQAMGTPAAGQTGNTAALSPRPDRLQPARRRCRRRDRHGSDPDRLARPRHG
jgi:hypothetical protein